MACLRVPLTGVPQEPAAQYILDPKPIPGVGWLLEHPYLTLPFPVNRLTCLLVPVEVDPCPQGHDCLRA